VIVLNTNNNYIVRSPNWDNGTVNNAGAVTWGSGLTGVSGVVSISNSLVGSSNTDAVGLDAVTPLQNGNYVVITTSWDDSTLQNVGAVT
jgi:hypothetical protein